MATMDIFNDDAFSAVNMTDAVDKIPYAPSWLGSLGIFTPRPVETTDVAIERRSGRLELIPTSERGGPLVEGNPIRRDIRSFRAPRIAKGETLQAASIQNVRAFGRESELEQVQAKVAEINARTMADMELTWEHMRLGAVQGVVADADGSTLFDWFDAWGISPPAEIDFDLDNPSPASGALKQACNDVIRTMVRAGMGAVTTTTRIIGLAGDDFYDSFTNHSEVRATYLNQAEASDLRNNNSPFTTFRFGGIDWINYRGTDDNSTVAVGTDKVKFFPVGAPGVFQVAYAPGESFDFVNRPGRPVYNILVKDQDRNFWVRPELYSYPLFYCTRPEMLARGKMT
ncbi:MAG TPA: major capsid protein [Geminicoccus sp.]|uniref:major capsid protein n=1 Tax=Geminicoccus sp. TaxID=2024832 RepID=UPI002BAED535|nr:major capsid protein [Geminicoccus sp.]HWL70423.1 major capsid protein [Geminicoccus sp.]